MEKEGLSLWLADLPAESTVVSSGTEKDLTSREEVDRA